MAEIGKKVWMKHGALKYVESVGDDMKSAIKWGCLPFPKMAKSKQNEAVVFSFILFYYWQCAYYYLRINPFFGYYYLRVAF